MPDRVKRDKQPVAILGASGIVGQVFAWLLTNHPWFEPLLFCATEKRTGQKYGKDIPWLLPVPMPEYLNRVSFSEYDSNEFKKRKVNIIFSALPGEVAGKIETDLSREGFYLFSNAGAKRMDDNIPIIIPEINGGEINQIVQQGYPENGFIVCNSNCVVSGLALAIAPLIKFGVKRLTIATYQSISGAGYPGISALDISGGLMTLINGEEEKIALETNKIFKTDIDISSTCVRVAVPFGHLITVWADFKNMIESCKIRNSWLDFGNPTPQLPSLPLQTLLYSENERELNPSKSFEGKPSGMQIKTGRLEVDKNRARFMVLVNNLVRGAAAGSIANAELFVERFGK